MRAGATLFLAVGLTAAAAGCSDGGPTEPKQVPGTVTLQLSAPADVSLGAIRLEIAGGNVSSVTPAGDALVFVLDTQSAYVIAAFGNLASGPLARVSIADMGSLEDYTIRITQIAGRDNALMSDMRNISMQLTP